MTHRILAVAGLLGCITAASAQTDAPPRLVAQYELGGCGAALFDADGVVQVTYSPSFGVDGPQYNPVTISQTALGCYHQYKRSGDAEAHRIFLDQIHWLITHAV